MRPISSLITAMTLHVAMQAAEAVTQTEPVVYKTKPAEKLDQTGGEREYTIRSTYGEDEAEETQLEIRDNRPEWQKIGDRKNRSRPNPKKSR